MYIYNFIYVYTCVCAHDDVLFPCIMIKTYGSTNYFILYMLTPFSPRLLSFRIKNDRTIYINNFNAMSQSSCGIYYNSTARDYTMLTVLKLRLLSSRGT